MSLLLVRMKRDVKNKPDIPHLSRGPAANAGWKMVNFGDVVNNANLVVRDLWNSGIERRLKDGAHRYSFRGRKYNSSYLF